jgi:hypothetical protein
MAVTVSTSGHCTQYTMCMFFCVQDAAKQFAGDLRPWATPLQGRDEVSPDDWRQARSWGSRLSPAEIGQAAQQVRL